MPTLRDHGGLGNLENLVGWRDGRVEPERDLAFSIHWHQNGSALHPIDQKWKQNIVWN
eukprot:CAMPEP_0182912828 /NCGR_PEP_ID=MMETSP0034_2-20130328/37720_1 /TAXON_ID=156128 /ORGANISM="Nephroselmis pyriformis, Strain CCMP717" /LENGTH=57 /DNA_ID=CAMNT_0025049521 /DNA_START=482 /DNA_END=655 /DNA_ORIENTATION=+